MINPYTYPCKCSVCGGDGVTKAGLSWFANKLAHKDPQVCAANLRREREKLAKEQALLEQMEKDQTK